MLDVVGTHRSIISVLKKRFEIVPKTIILEIKKIDNEDILTNIMADAISAPNIEAFRINLYNLKRKK